ncbi:spore germination protein GerW family protein [Cellulomonas sp. KRMCY2]|uniref:spore germination protein GerW family protein n=1 Tax=Cellulomonas sp. KRMCY2 TaxID=1304865 RepID=UPI00045E6447|nr:spore germination protein GerW family protein [Cellulomonas sp. KRMCY2]
MSTPENSSTSTGPEQHRPDRGDHPGRRRRGKVGPRGAATIPRVAADLLHVRRAFGEPVRHDDVTIVPVARVVGGSGTGYGTGATAGDGSGQEPGGSGDSAWGTGSGGGFGIRITPIGVYVVRGTDVQWQPAMDLNRTILGGQIVGGIALVALACALRRRRRA